jgi:hypothetical protein
MDFTPVPTAKKNRPRVQDGFLHDTLSVGVVAFVQEVLWTTVKALKSL